MNIKDKLNPLAASFLLFFAPMVLLVFLDYIWFSDILYFLPFYAIAVGAILLDKQLLAFIFLSSFVLAMLADYVIHLVETHPTLRGGFVFVALIVGGATIGLLAQYLWQHRRHKLNADKDNRPQ